MRYAKQTAVKEFGVEGQAVLSAATVAIIGCGGLGCLQAELLTRMGVGTLRIADPDIVTLGNLHRQLLFTEEEATAGTPKVTAAAARLATFNSGVSIRARPERITRDNITDFAAGADLILDATDQTATRYLINDFCLRENIPWIYTGVAGTGGMLLPILPQKGPCLRCLYPEPPAEGEAATCASNGILPPTVTLAVSLQVAQALRLLNRTLRPGRLTLFNVWEPSVRATVLHRDPSCPCCGRHRFDFLAPATGDKKG